MLENTRTLHHQLSVDARITRLPGGGNTGEQAFVKNVQTDRIYRMGPEELFLLRRLGSGESVDSVAASFGSRFGKVARPEVVRAFAADMRAAGLLVLLDPASATAARTGGRRPQLPAKIEQPERTPDEDEDDDDGAAESAGFDGGSSGPLTTLEKLIFGEEDDGAGQDDRPSGEEAGKGEAASPADPAIAARRVRFAAGAGAGPALKPPGMLRLFDPTPVLRALALLFGWVGSVKWLLWPLTLFAALTMLHRLSEVSASLLGSRSQIGIVAVLTLSLVTVNLFSRLVTGTTVFLRGAEVRNFGFVFLFFVVPRFAIDTSGVLKLPREDRLAVYASTMQARLFMFIAGTLVWALTRQSGTFLSELALVTSQIGLFTLLLTATPLIQSDGYRWITTFFNQPMLRPRAMAYVFGSSRSETRYPEPEGLEKWAFVLYAIGSALFLGLIGMVFVAYLATALEGRFRGTGVVVFLSILGLLVTWFLVMKASSRQYRKALVKEMMAERRAGERPGREREASDRALVPRRATQVARPRPMPLPGIYHLNARGARRSRWLARGFWAVVAVAVTYLAFQPYDYEVGGEFVILPDRRVEVVARVEGELIEVLVDEGDVVEEGQLLGRVLDRQARRNVQVTAAELSKAQAALQRKREGATPEEVQVARENVALAEAVLPFREAQAERAKQLLQGETISLSEAERRQTEYLQALQQLQTARANLAEVEAAAPESEIRMARAEVDRLRAELGYHEAQLTDTEIRAPTSGRVVTENVALSLGGYLDVGDVFIEIEDHSIAHAHVKISEADIGLVEAGDTVRLKAWGRSEAERVGVVVSIAPAAEQEQYGRVIRVKTVISNEDAFFRPEMTGFAKIEGARMPVWEAYTRLFDRFFRIEVWSWIP